MFEKEIKFINDLTISKLNGLGEFISLAQIKSAGIHPAVVKYIEAEIDYLIYEDRLKILKNSIFDYSGKKVEEHFKSIAAEIKKNKKFSQDYIQKLVLHSVSFNLNFLTKPNWSIARFLFDGSEEKSTADILNILNYLHYYDYLKKIIASYLEKKKLLKFSKSQLEELLVKIDQVGTESNTLPIIETAVKSISDFFNFYELKKTSINLNTVQLFLKDKNFISILEIVNQKFQKPDVNVKVEPVELISSIKAEFEKRENEKEFITEEITEIVEEKNEPEFEPETVQEEIPEIKEIEKFEPEVIEREEIQPEIETESEEIAEPETEVEIESDPTEVSLTPEPEMEIEELNEEPVVEEEQKKKNEIEIEEETEDDVTFLNLQDEIKLDEFVEESSEAEVELETEEVTVEVEEESETTEDLFEEIEEEIPIGEIEVPEIEEQEEKTDEIDLTIEREEEVSEPEIEEFVPDEEPEEEVKVEEPLEEEKGEDPFAELDEESKALEKLNEEIENSKLNLNVPIGSPVLSQEHNIEKEKPITEDEVFEEIVDIDEKHTKDFVVEEEFTNEKTFEEDKLGNEINSALHINEESNDDPDLASPEIDIADLLEHKKMTRIIEVIFDYDMEDFTSCIDKICECGSKDDAASVLENVFRQNGVKPTKKEAELFKDIIFEYFERK